MDTSVSLSITTVTDNGTVSKTINNIKVNAAESDIKAAGNAVADAYSGQTPKLVLTVKTKDTLQSADN